MLKRMHTTLVDCREWLQSVRVILMCEASLPPKLQQCKDNMEALIFVVWGTRVLN